MIASKNGPMNVVLSEPAVEVDLEVFSAYSIDREKKRRNTAFYGGREQCVHLLVSQSQSTMNPMSNVSFV